MALDATSDSLSCKSLSAASTFSCVYVKAMVKYLPTSNKLSQARLRKCYFPYANIGNHKQNESLPTKLYAKPSEIIYEPYH